MIPKPKRLIDPSAIEAVRKSWCEYCGGQASGMPHHVASRGAGNADYILNLIQLCKEHHTMAHSGEIPRRFLFGLIAKREGMSVEEVEQRVREMKA